MNENDALLAITMHALFMNTMLYEAEMDEDEIRARVFHAGKRSFP